MTIALVVAIVLAGIWAFRYVQQRSRPANQQQDEQVARVVTAIVKTDRIEQTVTLTGELKAIASVDIKPKISGRLERLALEDGTVVVEGTPVGKGQVVAVLEHHDLQAQVAQARAALETARAAVQAAEVNLKDAQREKDRMENLFIQGSATEQQRDRALAAYDRAVAGLAQAKAQLAQAQAALDLAEVTYNEAFLRSPLAGVVTAKYVDPGTMLSPATPVLQVQTIEQLKFLVAIPAEFLPRIDPDKTSVDVEVSAYPGRVFKARIAQVYPTVDPGTRTATLELLVENQTDGRGNYLLRPGMYATARVVLAAKAQAVVVPADALIRLLGKYYAFTVKDDKAVRKEVTLGIRSGQVVEVISGLSAGEELVISGQQRLIDGVRIERVEQDLTGGQGQ